MWIHQSSAIHVHRQGAVDLEEEERRQQQERSAAFQGSGFRLGDSEGPSAVVGGARQASKPVEKVHVFKYCHQLVLYAHLRAESESLSALVLILDFM